MPKYTKSIGIFGGTFDPIHFGHCRAALEIYQQLELSEMRLVPSLHPPHRTQPHVSALHRLNMVRLAIENSPLQIDDREMHREGPSYSVDTLMSIRREFPKASLCMIVGVDAFLSITSWYQWEKLIQLANIIVMHRKGFELPSEGPILGLLDKFALNGSLLNQHLCGKIVMQTISTLEISATQIRNLIMNKQNPSFLLPERVWEYIQKNELYGYDKGELFKQQEMIHV